MWLKFTTGRATVIRRVQWPEIIVGVIQNLLAGIVWVDVQTCPWIFGSRIPVGVSFAAALEFDNGIVRPFVPPPTSYRGAAVPARAVCGRGRISAIFENTLRERSAWLCDVRPTPSLGATNPKARC